MPNVRKNNRRPKKYRKKTGAVKKRNNAYKPANKRNVMKMLSPIIEKRKYQLIQDDNPILLNSEHTIIVPDVWEKMQREDEFHILDSQLTSRGFTGNTLFSRIVNHQQIIEFDAVNQIPYPVEMEQIVGWFKTPYITQAESLGQDSRNGQGVTYGHNMSVYIGTKIQNMLKDKFSNLDPKVVKINFRKRYNIKGSTIETENHDATGFEMEVIRKPLRNTFTWKPNRKYHMKPACLQDQQTSATYKPDDPSVYWTPSSLRNQDLWVPFIFYHFRNHDRFGKKRGDTVGNPNQGIPPEPEWIEDVNAYPHLFHKQTHYFTDL